MIRKSVQLQLRRADGGWVDLAVDRDRVVTMAWGGPPAPLPIDELRELMQELFDLGFTMGRDVERTGGGK